MSVGRSAGEFILKRYRGGGGDQSVARGLLFEGISMKRLGETSFRGKRQSREGGRVPKGDWMFFGGGAGYQIGGSFTEGILLFQWAMVDPSRTKTRFVLLRLDSAAHRVNRVSNLLRRYGRRANQRHYASREIS